MNDQAETTTMLDESAAMKAIRRYITNPPTNSRVFRITPSMAAEILTDLNIGNRPRKPGAIAKYTEAMANNAWAVTGDTVKFSDAGRLRDGQNRLQASVNSKCAFTTHVVFGVPDRYFDLMDRGKNRNPADILAIEGWASPRVLAQACRWHELLRTDRVKSRETFEPHQIKEMANAHPKLGKVFVKIGLRAERATGQPAGMIAALLMCVDEKNPRLASQGAQALANADFSGRFKPLGKCIRLLSSMAHTQASRVHEAVRMGMLIRAWALCVQGKAGTKSEYAYKLSDPFPAIMT